MASEKRVPLTDYFGKYGQLINASQTPDRDAFDDRGQNQTYAVTVIEDEIVEDEI